MTKHFRSVTVYLASRDFTVMGHAFQHKHENNTAFFATMSLTKVVHKSLLQCYPLAKSNSIARSVMAAKGLSASRSFQARIHANVIVVPSANSEQFERFCELNKTCCPLLYRSRPGDTTAEPLVRDSDIRYVKYFGY